VDALGEAVRKDSGIVPEFHRYPAGHAFFNDARPVYDAASADLAWRRTVPFLREQLG
jgi:carboxymethylenebutenolidase